MILGIDYGRSHLGLATSEGSLAKPEETIVIKDRGSETKDIEQRAREWKVDRIVIGVSEGKMADETKVWGKKLSEMLQLPVEFVDETLSSVEAGESKDKTRDHSKAAAVILQRYLDNNNQETR